MEKILEKLGKFVSQKKAETMKAANWVDLETILWTFYCSRVFGSSRFKIG